MKKSKKLLPKVLPAGKFDEGEKHYSGSLLQLDTLNAIEIHKPINERVMGQDPALTQGAGADSRKSLEKLNNKYQGNN